MGLKEKFFNVIFEYAWKFKTEKIVPECIKIADDYAVEFGYWILRNFNNYGPNDEKELLEIFKKEKGL
jgi:hypothetical protein